MDSDSGSYHTLFYLNKFELYYLYLFSISLIVYTRSESQSILFFKFEIYYLYLNTKMIKHIYKVRSSEI